MLYGMPSDFLFNLDLSLLSILPHLLYHLISPNADIHTQTHIKNGVRTDTSIQPPSILLGYSLSCASVPLLQQRGAWLLLSTHLLKPSI